MNYTSTIGLEIHAELKTKTKMFCGCLNDPDEKIPNTNICPICTGHPGTLPVANKEAIESIIKIGLAMGGEIAPPQSTSKFDRKNYFYPDLPKAYQISQYDRPIVKGGQLKDVQLTRIHLEEDTGRLSHGLSQVAKYSTGMTEEQFIKSMKEKGLGPSTLVDFNRSGLPLMELVTEPDIKSGKQAVEFAKELQLILRYLGISDADMEKGQMRVEANISLMRTDMGTNVTNEIRGISGQIRENSRVLGTKVEVKNLNSFKAVEDAVDYEIKRQAEVLESGEKVIHETRGWSEAKKATVSQRTKEQAHDYRYFPEPDLPPLDLSVEAGVFSAVGGQVLGWDLKKIKEGIVELPQGRRERFMKEFNLTVEQVEILVQDKALGEYFEEAVSELKELSEKNDYGTLYNYLTSDLKGLMKEAGLGISEAKITPHHFAHLISIVSSGKINSRLAKDILKEMFETGVDPESIMKDKGLDEGITDEVIGNIVGEVIAENPKAVEDYKKGNENSLQFLIGQAMKKLKGRGDPEKIKELFKSFI